MGFYLLNLLKLPPNPQLYRHFKQQNSRTKCFVAYFTDGIIYLTSKSLLIYFFFYLVWFLSTIVGVKKQMNDFFFPMKKYCSP